MELQKKSWLRKLKRDWKSTQGKLFKGMIKDGEISLTFCRLLNYSGCSKLIRIVTLQNNIGQSEKVDQLSPDGSHTDPL